MHCWNCGTRNPDENSFCGRCGRRIASTTSPSTSANDVATLAAADAAPPQANPLVEEPRVVRDSPRVIGQMETARSTSIEAPPTEPPARENLPPLNMTRTENESLPPLQMSRPQNPNRITGPSFLGLSDESAGTGSSDYLLYDDEPERSSWRGWLAFAVLVLLGFLVYKQWNAVSSGAQLLAQQAKSQIQQSATPSQPTSSVSGADQSASGPQNQPPNATTPPTPTTDSNAKKDDAVNKPEADHTNASAAEHQDETAAATKNETAGAAKDDSPAAKADESVAEDTVNPAPTKEAKKPTADDEDSREATPSRAATKAPTPAEPKFNDAQVEEAQRYLTGQGGTRQDCGRAISLLRSSARDGNPRAQVKLGALYATGQCVTQDRAAAYEWLARAQETQPHNNYLQRTMSSLWANMTPEERTRITK